MQLSFYSLWKMDEGRRNKTIPACSLSQIGGSQKL